MEIIDLFAGCGGMSLGFEMAGFRVAKAFEMDEWAAATYAANHPGTPVEVGDIRAVKDWTKAVLGPVDGIVGGPPCQGMSLCGNRDPKDPRNSLFMELVECARQLSPKFVLVENVPGLLSMRTARGEPVATAISDELEAIGYATTTVILDASRYGVPQRRRRVFFLGSKAAGLDPVRIVELPPEPEVTVDMAISDLPQIGAGDGREFQEYPGAPQNAYQAWARQGSDGVRNHVAMRHTRRLVVRFGMIRQGQSVADVPREHSARLRGNPQVMSGKAYGQNNMRVRGDEPAPTVAASFQSNFVHPRLDRNFTAREGARLQSFPDRYVFKGERTTMSWERRLSQYKQIGNAVPPLLAGAIGESIARCFEDTDLITHGDACL